MKPNHPIRSMTGFARVSTSAGNGEIAITIKSLNHRGLDLHFHHGAEVDPFENAMRSAIKRAVLRGHVDIRVSLVRSQDGATGLNEAMLGQYIGAFRRAAELHHLPEAAPDLNTAFRIPGMFGSVVDETVSGSLEPLLLAALEETLAALNQFRAREGAELAAVIRHHNGAIARRCKQVEDIRSTAMPAFQQRLTDRLKELLRGAAIDPQRLTQEAALISDRSDIGEECTRLSIHSRQLDELLSTGGEVGKKIDFLLQEMNRETNTILSKTNGIGDLGLKITDLALATKADIEKIREQALNLE
ncbi:MAG: YicC/YloC family endoribonuclease [Bryobacteraceae bacterium]